MQDEIQNKAIKKEEVKTKEIFHFPESQISVEAESLSEAQKLLETKLSENKNKN